MKPTTRARRRADRERIAARRAALNGVILKNLNKRIDIVPEKGERAFKRPVARRHVAIAAELV